MNWEIGININTQPCMEQTADKNLQYSTRNPTQCSVVTFLFWKEVQDRGQMDVYSIHVLFCRAETNIVLYTTYTPIKINLKNKKPIHGPILLYCNKFLSKMQT